MARNDPTIYMRIPQELKDALDKASEENRRSLTAEVVARLQASFSETATQSPSAELSRAVEELESLQLLGTLNYRLQRAHSQADFIDHHLRAGWSELQDAIKHGSPEEQNRMKEALAALNAQKNEIAKTISDIDAKISEIHFQRKVSNMRELRDVKPVHVSIRGSAPVDTGLVVHAPPTSTKPGN